MDFIVGILLMIIIILVLYNFATVSISNSNGSKSYNSNINTATTQYNSMSYQLPSPILSKSPSALNNKVNLNAQAYDYKQYFFV